MDPAKPSLALLRSLSDEHVLRTLMTQTQLTRAELATHTGLSKPTISESVRRLTEAGLLRDTGARTTGRGRVGTYYGLADGLGVALVVVIAPEGITAETIDVLGRTVSAVSEPVERPAHPDHVAASLANVVAEATRLAQAAGSGAARLAVVSAADPVDRHTGKLVHLPDAPFLLGDLSPVEILTPHVTGEIIVDNDVHWAARAEAQAAGPDALTDFAYLHLGDGLGAAVVTDGQILRGHAGIAGEIAHILTRGPGGQALTFMDAFAALDVHRPGSTAIDSSRLLGLVHDPEQDGLRDALAEAVCGVLNAFIAVADPQVVLLGGQWGADPAVVAAISERCARSPRSTPVRATTLGPEPWLDGARRDALDRLRNLIVSGGAAAEA